MFFSSRYLALFYGYCLLWKCMYGALAIPYFTELYFPPLPQTQPFDSHGEKTITFLYANWYLEGDFHEQADDG
jgi:hypothetical protein